jgi:hypothetical protein
MSYFSIFDKIFGNKILNTVQIFLLVSWNILKTDDN